MFLIPPTSIDIIGYMYRIGLCIEDTYYSQDLRLSLEFLFRYCSVYNLNKTPNVWPVLPELEDCSQFSS